MKILGIDPGLARTGYGFIEKKTRLNFLEAGAIDLKEKNVNNYLFSLGNQYEKLLVKLQPNIVALEKIYFSRNTKTALQVAHARGIISFLTLKKNIPLFEYSPTQIKQTVTGYGFSDKKAVAKMVNLNLNLNQLKGFDDISDALAVAITAAAHYHVEKNIDRES